MVNALAARAAKSKSENERPLTQGRSGQVYEETVTFVAHRPVPFQLMCGQRGVGVSLRRVASIVVSEREGTRGGCVPDRACPVELAEGIVGVRKNDPWPVRLRIGDLERKVHRHVPRSKELVPIDHLQLAHVDRHLVARNLDIVIWNPNQPEHSMWIWITGSAIETFTVTRADVVEL